MLIRILSTWNKNNKCSNWSEGRGFVQLMKHGAFHNGINRLQWEAIHGIPVKLGTSKSNLPQKATALAKDEAKLKNN